MQIILAHHYANLKKTRSKYLHHYSLLYLLFFFQIGYHTSNEPAPVSPDERDKRDTGVQWDIRMLQKYVRDHFPGLDDEPAIVEHCIITVCSCILIGYAYILKLQELM